jgi:ribosomal-protein-alanine N-acetyltransferase
LGDLLLSTNSQSWRDFFWWISCRDDGKSVAVSSQQKAQLSDHIRWMIRRDMSDVLEIERGCFEFPWTEEDFIRCLRQRNCIGMVAEYNEKIVGFMVYELHKDHLHVLNFAVHAELQKQGVGRHMVKKLVSKLSHQRRNRIMLEVRETNLAAQLFFRSLGFRATSVLRDVYDDSVEDAYLMQLCHAASADGGFMPVNRISRLAG